jgi:hypothetical protein
VLIIFIILGVWSIARLILSVLFLSPVNRVFTVMYLIYVSSVYNITAILWLQFMVRVMSSPMINVLYFLH